MSESTKKTLSNITLDWNIQDAMVVWLENTVIDSVKPATYGHYRLQYRNHICPKLGSYQIKDIDSGLLSDYFEYLMKGGRTDDTGGLSLKTVSDIRLIINAFYNALIIEGIIDSNPCSEVRMPQRKRKQISLLSPIEQQRLEEAARSSHNPNALGILLSLHTGVRIGELCALQQQNIDVEKRIVCIRSTIQRIPAHDSDTGKTQVIIGEPKTSHSIRDIPLPEPVLEALKPQLCSNPTAPLFSTRTGRFMEPRTYQDLFLRMLKKCQIAPVNFHTLRHTFAVRSLEKGADPHSLSKILGHSGPTVILNTYSQFLAEPSAEAAATLDQETDNLS